ncbi:MAG: hypothetical protein QOI90_1227, partial [Mycobacterium sp.]|nr:hypothetical protein [Mycobacterium sp.]
AWSGTDVSPGHHDGTGHAGHAMAHPAVGEPAIVGLWIGHWLLMVVAMMWPLYAASTAALARATFRRWRVAAVAAHVGAITALWLAFGVVGRGVYLLVENFVPAWVWSVAWLVVAVAVTWSMWRARLLRTCGRIGVIAPAGRRALITASGSGVRMFPRCVALCGPVMLAMVSSHQLLLMLGGSAAVWWEQRHPRAWRDPVPVALLVITAVVLVATTFWKDSPWGMR